MRHVHLCSDNLWEGNFRSSHMSETTDEAILHHERNSFCRWMPGNLGYSLQNLWDSLEPFLLHNLANYKCRIPRGVCAFWSWRQISSTKSQVLHTNIFPKNRTTTGDTEHPVGPQVPNTWKTLAL